MTHFLYIYEKHEMKKFNELPVRDRTILTTSIASFGLGWLITFTGLFLPPLGVIDNSIIIIAGQAFTYCATGLGIKSYVDIKMKESKEDDE